MKLDTGAPFSTFPNKLLPPNAKPKPNDSVKVFKWFDSVERDLFYDVTVEDEKQRWSFKSTMTGRQELHGLLGIDFMLQVKPLIVYVDSGGAPYDLVGQRKDVDYRMENVIQYS